MKRLPLALACVTLVLAAGPPSAWPQTPSAPPQAITYQGRLSSNTDDSPLTGTFDMVFKFFDAVTGGNLLLTDRHEDPPALNPTGAVGVSSGLYTVLLGTGNVTMGSESTLTGVFANRSSVYMSVTIANEELTPRLRLVADGYSINAARLNGRSDSDFLNILSTPQTKLGLLTASGGITGLPVPINPTDAVTKQYADGIGSGGSGGGWVDVASTVRLLDVNDRVGVGTASPEQKLHVLGTAAASNFALGVTGTGANTEGTTDFNVTDFGTVAASHLSTNRFFNGTTWTRRNSAFDGWIWLQRSEDDADGGYMEFINVPRLGTEPGTDNPLFRILAGGNVGIGTSVPVERLDVAGNIRASGNNLTLGDGLSATDKVIFARTAAASSPRLRFNVASSKWQFSNDGAAFTDFGPGTGTVTQVSTGSGLTGGPITTTGTLSIVTGGVTSAMIADGAITNADVASNAAIADAKLATISTAGKVADSALSSNVTKLGADISLDTADTIGVLPIAKGGTNNSAAYAAGSVVFSNGTMLTQNNANLFWDSANKRLGIGTTLPSCDLHIASTFAPTRICVENTDAFDTSLFLQVHSNMNGDPQIQFSIVDGTIWSVGADNSDSDKFKISKNGGLGGPSDFVSVTTGGDVGIGTSAPAALLDIAGDGKTVLLPRKSTAGDPTGVNGMLYYNSSSSKFRGFEAGTWKDAIGAGSGGITSLNGLTASSQTFANDANVTISSATSTHTLGWSGTLTVARGGTGAGTLTGLLRGTGTTAIAADSYTVNKVLVGNGTGAFITNTNFHWDNTNARLGIGATAPLEKLHVQDGTDLTRVAIGDNSFDSLQLSVDEFAGNTAISHIATNSYWNGTAWALRNGVSNGWIWLQKVDDDPGYGAGNTAVELYEQDRTADGGGVNLIARFDAWGNFTIVGNTATKNAGTTWAEASDRRLKEDIHDIENAGSVVDKLRPVKFRYTEAHRARCPGLANRHYYGYIAQEFQTVFPESVKAGSDGFLTVDSSNVVPYLVAAAQEERMQMADLRKTVAAQSTGLAAQAAYLSVLESTAAKAEALALNERRRVEGLESELSNLRAEIRELRVLVRKLAAGETKAETPASGGR